MFSVALPRRFAAAVPFLFFSFCTFVHSQTLTVLHTFHGPDGDRPNSGLIRGSDGNFYGTTIVGGRMNCGTVFKITQSGKFTSLYSFLGGKDGCNPEASVIRDPAGNLYGTTISGGPSNAGTVFKINSSGHESVLYAFTGGADGGSPYSDVVRDRKGNFCGTTEKRWRPELQFGGMRHCLQDRCPRKRDGTPHVHWLVQFAQRWPASV